MVLLDVPMLLLQVESDRIHRSIWMAAVLVPMSNGDESSLCTVDVRLLLLDDPEAFDVAIEFELAKLECFARRELSTLLLWAKSCSAISSSGDSSPWALPQSRKVLQMTFSALDEDKLEDGF